MFTEGVGSNRGKVIRIDGLGGTRRRLGLMMALTVALVLAGGILGFGPATRVAADGGVSTFTVIGQQCTSASTVDVTIAWQPLNLGDQFIYWSTVNNGFQAGTYTALGPVAFNQGTATMGSLPAGTPVFVMIGTVFGGQLVNGTTLVFTTGACSATTSVQVVVSVQPPPPPPQAFVPATFACSQFFACGCGTLFPGLSLGFFQSPFFNFGGPFFNFGGMFFGPGFPLLTGCGFCQPVAFGFNDFDDCIVAGP